MYCDNSTGSSSLKPMPGCLRNLLSSIGQMSARICSGEPLTRMRFVEPINNHEHAREAERVEHGLKLGQQLEAIVRAIFVRQRLTCELIGGELAQKLP